MPESRPGRFWKVPFFREPGCPVPEPERSLRYEHAEIGWVSEALAEVMASSPDESDQAVVAELRSIGAANELLQVDQGFFEYEPEWWVAARCAEGSLVGSVLPVLLKPEKYWREGRPPQNAGGSHKRYSFSLRPLVREPFMQPDQWISTIANASSPNAYWDEIEPMWVSINQSYCDQHDDKGLESFHEDALRLCTEPDLYERIRVKEQVSLQSQIDKLVDEALALANQDTKVKAIYFEYDYGGGPWGQLNAFLCFKHSSSRAIRESDWFAFCEQSVEGPNVAALFQYDRNCEMSDGLGLVAGAYVDAVLLASVVRSIRRHRNATLPFGFARHDHPVVHLSAEA